MSENRIRTYGKHGELTPKHIFTDHDWVREHQEELVDQYGECYMVVYHEKALGVGKTRDEAVQNAELALPDDVGEIEVIVERVDNPTHWIGAGLLRFVPQEPTDDQQS
jgi:hypothetical protein